MPRRKHYNKELGKRLTGDFWYEFLSRGGRCAIAWNYRKPIHILSNDFLLKISYSTGHVVVASYVGISPTYGLDREDT